ncbi:MAG: hypothetical protein IJO06_14710 [Thermoguttaceae bacterium]|nr:hypothetical protein [Thermoguttaceae bacterium]
MKASLTKTSLLLALSACGVGFAQDAPNSPSEAEKAVASTPASEGEQAVAETLFSGNVLQASNLLSSRQNVALANGLTFALLVGREVDENSPMRLPTFSKKDVASGAALLKEKNGLFDRNAATMTSEADAFYLKPTRSNVLSMLRRVADEALEEDSIWVVFSGNGVSYEGDAAFLPQGAKFDDPTTWIFESEVREILAESKAKNVVSVWLTHRRVYQVPNPTPRERRAIEAKEGAERVAIFACSNGGSAWEAREAELDLFWSCFLTAANASDKPLRGEALRRAFDEAAAKTSEATKANEFGPQKPEWQNF